MIASDKEFLQRALKSYDNPQCFSLDEFKSDLDRFGYIKKIFDKYLLGTAEMNERLVLNHLVICFNVFGDTTLNLAFYKIEKSYWPMLIPYFIFLNRMPEDYHLHGEISWHEIKLDQAVIDKLRSL